MELKEKWIRRLADWYDRLRGERDQALRPRDVLAALVDSLESMAREGLDGAQYVPNRIVVRVGVSDDDERAYVRALVDGPELAAALESELVALGYGTRGPLWVTVEDHPWTEDSPRVTFHCRFESDQPAPSLAAAPAAPAPPAPEPIPVIQTPAEPRTAHAGALVALLDIQHPGGRCETVPVGTAGLRVGRGRSHGNDLVLGDDPQVSKVHARFDSDRGQLLVTDLRSTNGTVIGTRTLAPDLPTPVADGDIVRIGATVVHVRLAGDPPTVVAPPGMSLHNPAPPAAAGASFALAGPHGEIWPLGSSMQVGSALVDDIVVIGDQVGSAHARVTVDGGTVRVEDLGSRFGTRVNGQPIPSRLPVVVRPGDTVRFGDVETRLSGGPGSPLPPSTRH